MTEELFLSNDWKYIQKKILTDRENIPCNLWDILFKWYLVTERYRRELIKLSQEFQRIKFRIIQLEKFKSYVIESVIEAKSFAEFQEYINDRYGEV